MRIVDVCAFYSPSGGGVRTYVDAKFRAAPSLGHELIVLAPGEHDEVRKIGPNAILATIPAPTLPVDRRYRYFDNETRLHRELDRWRPDHVEATSPWSSAAMVGRWQGAATRSLIMHCDPLAAYAYRSLGGFAPTSAIDRLFGWYWSHLRRLDGMFDLVVCANRQLASRLDRGGLGKSEAIGMGVEQSLFSPALRSQELRAATLGSLGLGADATLLIGVGRLSAEKRWDMVIRAAADARPKVGLILVGDGPRRPQLERLARGSDSVRLLGPIADRAELARLLASSDALVHGCEAETFCVVAAEARASGIPLIVPDRGAAADHPVRGAGVVYRSGNRRSLENAIRRFIDRGPELQRMRATLRCDVRTMDEHFVQLFNRYEALCRTNLAMPELEYVEPVARLASRGG